MVTSASMPNPSEYDYTEAKREDVSLQPYEEDLRDPSTSSGMDYDPKSPNTYKETSSANTNKIEDLRETSNFEEKTLKKPDKIVPCPRCESMDTKFCYYNNYNVNQPRHFCKNCQRYWTAGGTMRNLPVGSGRRKSKSASASWYRHIVVSEALRAAGAKATSGIHHPSVLAFRSDAPLCESMTSALNLKDKAQNSLRNEFQQQKQKKVDDHPTVSSTAALSLTDMVKNGQSKNIQCNPRQVSIFPDPPWPYQWNSAQFRSPMAPISPTNFDPSSFPASVYPTPQYWGYTLPGPWSLPWLSQHSISPNHQNAFPSGPSSPLGKHSRDGSMLKASSNSGKVKEVLIPKTLIINDSNEPAKGLIWSALGIQNEGDNSVAGASLFNAFQTKDDQQNYVAENSMPLHANPAALSRSLNFHESS